jgi:hypothetical protein
VARHHLTSLEGSLIEPGLQQKINALEPLDIVIEHNMEIIKCSDYIWI